MTLKSTISTFGVVFLNLALPSLADSTPQDVARKLFPRTVLLTMKDADARPLSLGSGFVLKPGFIVSNFHVVEGAGSGLVKCVNDKTTYRITGIAAKDEARDLVILAVDGIAVDGVTLSQKSLPAVGETVFAVGNPRGLEGTFSQGIVSSVRELDNLTLLQITAPISPGSSGGPIADVRSEVVGVAVATFRGGQNLNFAVPVKYVAELAGKIGPPSPLTNEAKRTKTKSLFSGLDSGKSTDGVTTGLFLWDNSLTGQNESHPFYGTFSVSLKNNLDTAISDPIVLLVFHKADGEVVESTILTFKGILIKPWDRRHKKLFWPMKSAFLCLIFVVNPTVSVVIPPGMAKRVKGSVDPSVKQLTTPYSKTHSDFFTQTPNTKLEFRTLSFSLEEN